MKVIKIIAAVFFAAIGLLLAAAKVWIGAVLGIGIAVGILLLKSPKKAAKPAPKTAAAPAAPKAAGGWIFEKEFYTKLAGVSFTNEDGSSRQEALADLRDELAEETEELDSDDDEIEGVRLNMEPYEWEGAPAIRVRNGSYEIGNLSAELAAEIARKWSSEDYQIRLYATNVTGSQTLGCNVRLEVWRRRSQ